MLVEIGLDIVQQIRDLIDFSLHWFVSLVIQQKRFKRSNLILQLLILLNKQYIRSKLLSLTLQAWFFFIRAKRFDILCWLLITRNLLLQQLRFIHWFLVSRAWWFLHRLSTLQSTHSLDYRLVFVDLALIVVDLCLHKFDGLPCLLPLAPCISKHPLLCQPFLTRLLQLLFDLIAVHPLQPQSLLHLRHLLVLLIDGISDLILKLWALFVVSVVEGLNHRVSLFQLLLRHVELVLQMVLAVL